MKTHIIPAVLLGLSAFISACGKNESTQPAELDINNVKSTTELAKNIGELVKNEDSATSFAIRGEEACEKGDFEIAMKLFDQGIQKDQKDGYVYRQRAECNLVQKNYQLALSDANKALELDSDGRSWANELIGRSYHGLKKYNEAIEAFKRPDATAKADYYMALSYFELGESKRAIELVSKAIDHGCDNCLFTRGVFYYNEENYSLAIDDLLKANRSGEFNSVANYFQTLGESYYLIGQKSEALATLKKACDLGECELYNAIRK